jgi:pimeloyl-ACP methyl ester carboxylesterase
VRRSRLTAGVVTGAALGGAMAGRLARSRRLSRRRTGPASAVRTDDGVRLQVQKDGPPGSQVAVVLVHGIGADASMFDPQWELLRRRCRVVRFDQRGHGASGWRGPRSATVPRLGRDLEQVIAAEADDLPVVVVGHSMGGMAVLALAARRPDLFGARITGVALLSTRAAPLPGTGAGTSTPGRVRVAVSRAVAWLLWTVAPVIEAAGPFRSRPGRWVLRRRLFADDPPAGAVRGMARRWAGVPLAVPAAFLTSLVRYDQRAALAALRGVPVLVLAGTEDATIPPDSARRLAGGIGHRADLVLVEGAGHMVGISHPTEVDDALDRLLTRAAHATDRRRTT